MPFLSSFLLNSSKICLSIFVRGITTKMSGECLNPIEIAKRKAAHQAVDEYVKVIIFIILFFF